MSDLISSDYSITTSPELTKSPSNTIHIVKSRSDVTEFINLPKRIYCNDPSWIAPLDIEVRQFLSQRHPFLKHGEAQWLLARQGGHVVGRIIVSDDPIYNQQHQSDVGCFGMFDCVNDIRVAQQLVNAASKWLTKRGRTQMMGPIDYSTNYPCGQLVDGFNTPPRVMMNHQPKYGQQLLEQLGFEKLRDMYAWWFDAHNNKVDKTWSARVNRLAARSGLTVRSIRPNEFRKEIALCQELYNEAWEDNWGFVKMTNEEFEHMAKTIRKIAIPELILIAELDGKPVGLAISLPDINEAIAPLKGRLTRYGLPIGLARLLVRLRKVKTIRLALLGVKPEFRRRGIAEMLIWKTFENAHLGLGMTGAELSWTLEDNDMINRAIQRAGAYRYKTYRIFQRDL